MTDQPGTQDDAHVDVGTVFGRAVAGTGPVPTGLLA